MHSLQNVTTSLLNASRNIIEPKWLIWKLQSPEALKKVPKKMEQYATTIRTSIRSLAHTK